jgi:hypothetical protein
MGRRALRLLLASAIAAVAVPMQTVSADVEVQNPGPVTFTSQPGSYLDVNGHTFQLSKPATFSGSITSTGAVTVPKANIHIPPFTVTVGGNPVTVTVVATTNVAGLLDPETGVASVHGTFAIHFSGSGVPSGCQISPVTLKPTTGTSGSLTGVAYSQSNGSATVVDGLFSVPASHNCGFFYGPAIDGYLGLPSASGKNKASLAVVLNPIILSAG